MNKDIDSTKTTILFKCYCGGTPVNGPLP